MPPDREIQIYDYPLIIRFRGEYDYDGLLSLIRRFYKRSFFDIQEPKFKYKTHSTGAEVEFVFQSDRKVTHYIRVHLFVDGHLWDVKRDKSGKTNGKLDLRINAKMKLDYASEDNKSGFGFRDDKFGENWMREKLDTVGTGLQFGDNKVTGEKYLEKLTQKLQTEIKKHLKMECV